MGGHFTVSAHLKWVAAVHEIKTWEAYRLRSEMLSVGGEAIFSGVDGRAEVDKVGSFPPHVAEAAQACSKGTLKGSSHFPGSSFFLL